MLVLVVDAGQALAVKHAVVAAIVDPGAVLHTLKHRRLYRVSNRTLDRCGDKALSRILY